MACSAALCRVLSIIMGITQKSVQEAGNGAAGRLNDARSAVPCILCTPSIAGMLCKYS